MKTEREFTDSDPYRSREDAVEDYLTFLKKNRKLQTDEYGIPKIKSSSGIPEKTEL
jgi:hypothetical protein